MPNPYTELPRVAEIEAEFGSRVYTDGKASWYEAVEMVKSQIEWLSYVPEGELSESELEHLILHLRRAYVSLRRLTARYID
jgi:hypothetical protein